MSDHQDFINNEEMYKIFELPETMSKEAKLLYMALIYREINPYCDTCRSHYENCMCEEWEKMLNEP